VEGDTILTCAKCGAILGHARVASDDKTNRKPTLVDAIIFIYVGVMIFMGITIIYLALQRGNII
jgi:hypothetical protein